MQVDDYLNYFNLSKPKELPLKTHRYYLLNQIKSLSHEINQSFKANIDRQKIMNDEIQSKLFRCGKIKFGRNKEKLVANVQKFWSKMTKMNDFLFQMDDLNIDNQNEMNSFLCKQFNQNTQDVELSNIYHYHQPLPNIFDIEFKDTSNLDKLQILIDSTQNDEINDDYVEDLEAFMGVKFRKYQIECISWQHSMPEGSGAIMADYQGLGRRLTALANIGLMAMDGKIGPHLIVTSTDEINSWISYIMRFLKSLTVSSDFKEDANIYITTYNYQMVSPVKFKSITIESPSSTILKASSLEFRKLCSLNSEKRFVIVDNFYSFTLEQIWAILKMLLPNIFITYQQFKSDFFNSINKNFTQNLRKSNLSANLKLGNASYEILLNILESDKYFPNFHNMIEGFVFDRWYDDVAKHIPDFSRTQVSINLSQHQLEVLEESLNMESDVKLTQLDKHTLPLKEAFFDGKYVDLIDSPVNVFPFNVIEHLKEEKDAVSQLSTNSPQKNRQFHEPIDYYLNSSNIERKKELFVSNSQYSELLNEIEKKLCQLQATGQNTNKRPSEMLKLMKDIKVTKFVKNKMETLRIYQLIRQCEFFFPLHTHELLIFLKNYFPKHQVLNPNFTNITFHNFKKYLFEHKVISDPSKYEFIENFQNFEIFHSEYLTKLLDVLFEKKNENRKTVIFCQTFETLKFLASCLHSKGKYFFTIENETMNFDTQKKLLSLFELEEENNILLMSMDVSKHFKRIQCDTIILADFWRYSIDDLLAKYPLLNKLTWSGSFLRPIELYKFGLNKKIIKKYEIGVEIEEENAEKSELTQDKKTMEDHESKDLMEDSEHVNEELEFLPLDIYALNTIKYISSRYQSDYKVVNLIKPPRPGIFYKFSPEISELKEKFTKGLRELTIIDKIRKTPISRESNDTLEDNSTLNSITHNHDANNHDERVGSVELKKEPSLDSDICDSDAVESLDVPSFENIIPSPTPPSETHSIKFHGSSLALTDEKYNLCSHSFFYPDLDVYSQLEYIFNDFELLLSDIVRVASFQLSSDGFPVNVVLRRPKLPEFHLDINDPFKDNYKVLIQTVSMQQVPHSFVDVSLWPKFHRMALNDDLRYLLAYQKKVITAKQERRVTRAQRDRNKQKRKSPEVEIDFKKRTNRKRSSARRRNKFGVVWSSKEVRYMKLLFQNYYQKLGKLNLTFLHFTFVSKFPATTKQEKEFADQFSRIIQGLKDNSISLDRRETIALAAPIIQPNNITDNPILQPPSKLFQDNSLDNWFQTKEMPTIPFSSVVSSKNSGFSAREIISNLMSNAQMKQEGQNQYISGPNQPFKRIPPTNVKPGITSISALVGNGRPYVGFGPGFNILHMQQQHLNPNQ
eukprot:TRINITY_DN1603_c0_g1_i1.p1 TRINITY_DN1603_c0_g1~~TRINITY_DN1603_c0_g1_i1.p1  ORF type:complete len:1360 (+),score=353.63 TRINITY_DN1603_c0_g1_i1:37-4116(+)